MIPPILKEVVDYLKKSEFNLVTGNDARMDSNQSEAKVIQILQNANKWKIYSPNVASGNNRAWYDMKVDNYYVDIKISRCKASDNTNAKMAIYYFLTGILPDTVTSSEREFFDSMKKNEKPSEDRDFYYLIINKENLSDIFVTSLKGLSHVSPASRNLPFQSNWGRCREITERNWEESKRFLLKTWAISVERNIKNHKKSILESYPEFFTIEILDKKQGV